MFLYWYESACVSVCACSCVMNTVLCMWCMTSASKLLYLTFLVQLAHTCANSKHSIICQSLDEFYCQIFCIRAKTLHWFAMLRCTDRRRCTVLWLPKLNVYVEFGWYVAIFHDFFSCLYFTRLLPLCFTIPTYSLSISAAYRIFYHPGNMHIKILIWHTYT